VFVLMPVALYPTYQVTADAPSVAAYWQEWLSLPFWPCGPQWFLWQLLALNIAAAIVHRWAPHFGESLGRLTSICADPARFFVALATASALAYIPLALAFTPWTWTQFGPFALQLSRPLHYCVYFIAGVAVGTARLDAGLLASDGMLPRRWTAWLGVAFGTFLLWIIPMAVIMERGQPGSLPMQIATDLGFSLACAGGCMFAMSVALRFATQRTRALDSLSQNAYGMYLIHYVFVVWLQYALLDRAVPAIVKGSMVFGGTLLLSWAVTAGVCRIPLGARLIGTPQRALAEAP
jgi:Acyltransferase family